MSYATQQDLVDRFGAAELIQLTDRANVPPTTIAAAVVAAALADAHAIVDSYLGKAVALPIAIVPDALTKVEADIARYYLHGEAAEKDSVVSRNHAAAIAWLKDVAKGLVQLDVGGVPVAQPGSGAIKANPSGRIMRRETLAGL